MLESFFQGVFDTQQTPVIAPGAFLLCIAASIGLGLLLCLTTLWRTRCTKSFAVTLALLPAVVCVVIMMVNGNVGTGVAVAGAFSLVRFRSAPGSAREIGAIFIAMGTGLMTGMGYLGYALVFVLILGGMTIAPLPELMDRKKRDIMERKGDKEDENKRQKQQKERSAAAL